MKTYDSFPEVFEVELDYDGQIDDIFSWGEQIPNEVENEIEQLVKSWVDRNLVGIGQRTTFTVRKENGYFDVSGMVCTELGEEEPDDVWEEFSIRIDF